MVGGHMCVGVIEDMVVARVGPDHVEDAMRKADIGPMDFTGRPMKGGLFLHRARVDEADGQRLDMWVGRARRFVASLGPPKPKNPPGAPWLLVEAVRKMPLLAGGPVVLWPRPDLREAPRAPRLGPDAAQRSVPHAGL